jgi:monoamine oxidase
MTEGGYLKMIA